MGIRGLQTYLVENRAFDIVDLVMVAKNSKQIEILVDFNAYERELIELLLERMNNEYDNEFLLFPGGEFDIIFNAFYDFHKLFENIGIKLVWIVDGPKGLDKESSAQKTETWIKRDNQEISNMNEVLLCCKNKERPKNLNNLMPLCTFEVAISSLKKAGAEIIQLLQGESDEFIAYENRRRNSFAILTNDTDFLLFQDCKVLFPRLMKIPYNDSNRNLPFFDNENPGKIFKSPESFKCPIVKPQHIINLLKLRNHGQLVAVSILKGNDNTNEFSQELQYSLKITNGPTRNAHITKVAQYISQHDLTIDNLLEFKPIMNFARQCPKLITSIKFCRGFYSLERIEENIRTLKVVYQSDVFDNPLTDYLALKLSNSELCKAIYSLHYGTINDAIYAENPSSNCSPISTIMATISAKVYSYILQESLDSVTEWRSRGDPKQVEVPVEHATIKTNDIHSKTNITDSSVNGIDLFENIWSHLESDGCLHYVDKFGLDYGFICYILRYFYKITKNTNLDVSAVEFRALFVSVFYNYSLWKSTEFNTKLNRESFLRMKICPTPKCLIMNAWFLRIYWVAKYLCGGAFNIAGEFPSIQNLFSGSVFFAFYENVMNETNGRTKHLDSDLQDLIGNLEIQIMEKNKEMYISITK